MADAGRAMMLYRGLYDNTHTYEKLDVVNYNGSEAKAQEVAKERLSNLLQRKPASCLI